MSQNVCSDSAKCKSLEKCVQCSGVARDLIMTGNILDSCWQGLADEESEQQIVAAEF